MSSPAPIETEAKFRLRDSATGTRYHAQDALGEFRAASAPRTTQHEDRYLDTPDGAMARAGYAARLRQSPAGMLVTVKSLGRANAGGSIHRRGELAVDETTGVLPKAKAVLVALLAALYVGCGGMMVSGSLARANNAIEARNYQDALQRLSEAERYATDAGPQEQAEIAYLRGVCLEGLGRNADAEGQFQFVADRFPNTEYGYRAKEWLKHKGEHGSP